MYVCVSRGERCSFFGNLVCFVFLKHPFWDPPFCLIIDYISNNRPISSLPSLFKIVGKVVLNLTNKFLNDDSIFQKFISEFRSKHWTDLLLTFLNDKTLKGFSNGLYPDMILAALQRSFDTKKHKVCLDKFLPIISFFKECNQLA